MVSAQKREQNIRDVGISIAAFTGDQPKAKGIHWFGVSLRRSL